MAFDTYLKVEGVEGTATAKGVEKWMELLSFSWGASNPTTIGTGGGGVSGGKVSMSSFNVMKKSESASAKLFAKCCEGKAYDKATVVLRKAGGDAGQLDFIKYDFETVFVESIQWSGSGGGDDTPTESLSFAFGKVKIEYFAQDNKGGVKSTAVATFNVQTGNKA